MTTYFHGGPAGLKEILPPTRTKVRSSHGLATAQLGADHIRADRVYLTTSLDDALAFAAANPSGAPGSVYEVEPFGDTEPDIDYTGPDEVVHCSRARVKRVVARRVVHGVYGLRASMEEEIAPASGWVKR